MFHRLREEFKIKPEDCPIFFLYDRDVLSYKRNELRGQYVRKYTDPYGNEYGNQGQLLLSYQAIESYLLSLIQDDAYQESYCLGKDVKPILTNAICPDEANKTDIHLKTVDLVLSDDDAEAEHRIIHSINEMDKGLEAMNIADYDLDYLAPTLSDVYDYQQNKYITENTFSMLSLVGMALLELGIIVEIDSNDFEY